MTLEQYIDNINKRYKLGNATEHTFRGDLQQLLESLVPDIRATNEPKRQSCGAPDYILTKKEIPVGFIEAKDIGDKDLEGAKKTGNKEQFDRYKASLNNLIFTDYLDFHLYIDGIFITKIAIAEIQFPSLVGVSAIGGRGGTIVPLPENFANFENLIKDFCSHVGQTIKSSKKLAEMMAGKARLLSDIIGKALTSDEANQEDSTLKDQMLAFKDILIHDITPQGFADVYAQTIAYGMFAARLHDPTLETFSRQEAAELIPKSNPFLRKLFGYIAGPDIDDRIKWIVDSLTDIFLACSVEEILKNYGKSTKMEDPIIHFYETFLSEYDPKLRKARGVWYTPAPVVNFIVRAVDDILKTEFDLPQGLADTSKTKITHPYPSKGGELTREVHKVQILDPATGTGTFLAEVIKHIHKKFQGQQGIWSNYVETHLLPRLNGFELLMASYAMAHLKLDLLLTETGYKPTDQFPSSGGVSAIGGRGGQRLRVYLTNSLEEHHQDTGTLFANWLSTEANEANHIKRDTPVMCVIGNPPYFGFKSNDGEWITNLTNDYKFIDGQNINEKKHRLGNDYVKFIRFGQYFIDKNQSGILSYINDHGFLFNPTFKGMRWNLMKSFDKIYILDLHGNSKKKEKGNDGSKDENVFDIQQGVSINIFVKTGKKKKNELAKIFYYDILGLRNMKYDFLSENSLSKIQFKEIFPNEPFYFFLPNKLTNVKDYEVGFSMSNFFNIGVTGTVTGDDNQLIAANRDELEQRLCGVVNAQIDNNYVKSIEYRPFDKRAMYFLETFNKNPYSEINVPASYRSRYKVMQHLTKKDNYCLVIGRQGQVVGDMPWNIIFVSNSIVDLNMFYRGGGVVSPLYLYPEKNGQQTIDQTTERTPNLNTEIVKQIAEKLGLTFTNEKEHSPNPSQEGNKTFAPIDILDYIYAVLHSPTYREKYKEFLKIDFPRVPYPSTRGLNPLQIQKKFWQLVKLGGEIRQIHLLESPVVENYITQYPIDGDNVVTKPRFQNSPPLEGCPTGGVVKTDQTVTINNTQIKFSPILELPYNPNLKQRAKELRQARNLPEVLFWMQVTKGGFHKIDFDRQRVIGNFIVDFYIKKLGLVIEIDGSSHDGKEEYDAAREEYLVSLGLKVYRIQVNDVMKQMNSVLTELENYIVENYGVLGNSVEPPRSASTVAPPRPPMADTPPKEGNKGKVYINDTQYFANVPQTAWEFYIGGYQPAQKWLKDRKERTLEFDDILHYQKIIVALAETDRLMKEIDKIEI